MRCSPRAIRCRQPRARRFSSFTLGLNQMASESSPGSVPAVHLAPSSPRARLWPLPGRYVARLVSSGEVVAGAEPFRLRRPRPHARIQTRLFISSARAFMRDHCAREIANLPELGDGVLHRGGRAIAALASSARASANNADIRLDTAPRARATVIRVRGAREFALLLLDYGRFCRLSGRKHCTLNECGADECR